MIITVVKCPNHPSRRRQTQTAHPVIPARGALEVGASYTACRGVIVGACTEGRKTAATLRGWLRESHVAVTMSATGIISVIRLAHSGVAALVPPLPCELPSTTSK